MKYLVIFLALFMLASPAYADSGHEDNPDGHGCAHSGGFNCGEPGEHGGDGSGTNTNTNDNTNTNTQGQQQGQIQGQIATGGDATATGGSVGDTTATGGEGGNAYAGAAIIIGGGSQGECYDDDECDGGSAPFSNNNEIDNSSNATTGDQTTTVIDNSFDGGNTLIIGGGQGECYEGECEGGGTLTSNAENNVDVSNDSSSTSTANSDSNSSSESNNTNDNSNAVATNVDVVVEGDDIVYEAAAIPVNSAPPSFAAICSSGMAGSGSKISLSFAVTSDVCTALMMADAYNAMGNADEVNYWIERAARHARWKGNVGLFRTVITLGIL